MLNVDRRVLKLRAAKAAALESIQAFSNSALSISQPFPPWLTHTPPSRRGRRSAPAARSRPAAACAPDSRRDDSTEVERSPRSSAQADAETPSQLLQPPGSR